MALVERKPSRPSLLGLMKRGREKRKKLVLFATIVLEKGDSNSQRVERLNIAVVKH